MKKILVCLAAVLMSLSSVHKAQATILFLDDFSSGLNWNTAPFVYTSSTDGSDPVGTPYAELWSRQGYTAIGTWQATMWKNNISTLGYENIELSYYWRTAFAEPNDILVTAWKPSSAAAWNLFAMLPNNSWNNVSFNLPAAASDTSIDVAFRLMNNSNPIDGDLAGIDNVEVSGNIIPEPATLSLLGMGLLSLLGFRKKAYSV